MAFWKHLFTIGRQKESNDRSAFAIVTGQEAVDTRIYQPGRNLTRKLDFFAQLRQEEKLVLFESIYRTQPLAAGAVNVLTRFVNTRMICKSGNAAIDKRTKEIWEQIDGHTVNGMLVRQANVFGFAVGEWVLNDDYSLRKIAVLPSLQIRKIADQNGDIAKYIQFPNVTAVRSSQSTIGKAGRKEIDAVKMIDYVRDPDDSFDYYGDSIFSAAVDMYANLCKILDAQISVYMRLGAPRYFVQVAAKDITPEEMSNRVKLLKSTFEGLKPNEDLIGGGLEDIKIIGAESFGQKFADETRLQISMILSSLGIPPALLHVSTQSSAGAESFARQSIIAMQSMIDNQQEAIAAAWNMHFWPVVARLEGMPISPKIGFERPRLLEQSIEEKARELRWNNDLREVVFGIREPEWLAQRVGANESYDDDMLRQMIEDARATYSPQPLDSNETNATSADSLTKGTDERATGNQEI